MKLIQKYLHGELTPTEQEEFQRKLQEDPAFAEELEAATVLMAQYKVEKKKRWQEMLEKRQEQGQEDAVVRVLRPGRGGWLRRIAAAVILLLIGSFAYWYFASGPSLENMVADYVADRHVPPTTTMGSEEAIDLWRQSRQAYLDGNFTEVIRLISLMQNEVTLNAEQHFYLGLAHLYAEVPDYDESILQMARSADLDPLRFGEQADWYRSLAYLRQNRRSEAQALLTKIVNARSWHYEEAQTLITKLGN